MHPVRVALALILKSVPRSKGRPAKLDMGITYAFWLRVIDEETLRQLVPVASNCQIQEIGVFPAPEPDFAGSVIASGIREGYDFAISAEWFSDADLESHFSDEPTITALLPGGLVKRLDIDPRILVFENLPQPLASLGYVARAGDRRWVMDSRDKPAVLLLSHGNDALVFWGESGALRVFVLRSSAGTDS